MVTIAYQSAYPLQHSPGKSKLRLNLLKDSSVLNVAARKMPTNLLQTIWHYLTSYFWARYEVTTNDGQRACIELNVKSLARRLGIEVSELRKAKSQGIGQLTALVNHRVRSWSIIREQSLPQGVASKVFDKVIARSTECQYTYEKSTVHKLQYEMNFGLSSREIHVLNSGVVLAKQQDQFLLTGKHKDIIATVIKIQDLVQMGFMQHPKTQKGDANIDWAAYIAAKFMGASSAVQPLISYDEEITDEEVMTNVIYPKCTPFLSQDYREKHDRDSFLKYFLHLEGAVKSLKAMHAQEIKHSDIKPSNIFMRKVGDNEESVLFDLDGATKKGIPCPMYTLSFVAPELISIFYGENGELINYGVNVDRFDESSDIWAMGLTLLLSLYKSSQNLDFPWINKSLKETTNINNNDLRLALSIIEFNNKDYLSVLKALIVDTDEHDLNPDQKGHLWSILKGCLNPDPKERVSAAELAELMSKLKSVS